MCFPTFPRVEVLENCTLSHYANTITLPTDLLVSHSLSEIQLSEGEKRPSSIYNPSIHSSFHLFLLSCRLSAGSEGESHISPVPQFHHWLPVTFRTYYKIILPPDTFDNLENIILKPHLSLPSLQSPMGYLCFILLTLLCYLTNCYLSNPYLLSCSCCVGSLVKYSAQVCVCACVCVCRCM